MSNTVVPFFCVQWVKVREAIVCIVDICGIVDHLCLNCLLITHSLTLLLVCILFVGLWYLMLQNNFNIETICIIIPYIIYYI
jgi:hypothetical protein